MPNVRPDLYKGAPRAAERELDRRHAKRLHAGAGLAGASAVYRAETWRAPSLFAVC